MDGLKYSTKWKERFAFFEQNGAPDTPEHKAAIKAAKPALRVLIGMNIIAFFFGFIYFFVLGLWKKNLVLIAGFFCVGLVIGIVEIIIGADLPLGAYYGIGLAMGLMWSMIANYAYYLKEIKGSDNWNPFEGIKLI